MSATVTVNIVELLEHLNVEVTKLRHDLSNMEVRLVLSRDAHEGTLRAAVEQDKRIWLLEAELRLAKLQLEEEKGKRAMGKLPTGCTGYISHGSNRSCPVHNT